MSSDVIANKYRIVREIARSNDVVYEATDTTMGRRLAIKELVIPPNLTGQARRERIERFNREARATGKLSHPGIVTVYDYGEDNGRYFIAMEYLEGGTLRDLLQSRGALPLNEAIDIAMQVLSALSHAHAHQVVHRDVKPDNIHILPGGQIKLTDFGIARLTEEASLTGEGQVFGTPSYMSPEQIEGRFIDHRSDLFSLGILLYEMIAGRKPFTGDSVVSITYNIMRSDPPPLAGIPFGVEQVIFRALAKDPGRRFSSADEMRNALKNADAAPPSMFFTPGASQTGMGMGSAPYPTYGPSGGYTPAGGYASTPYSPAPIPGSVPIPTGQGSTVFAPPPANAPPAQTGGGPFVNWGATNTQGAAAPPAYPPPVPYPRRPAGPILSDSARTMLMTLLGAVALGCIIVGFVLLFLRAYDQRRVMGAEEAVNRLVAQGNAYYDRHDLPHAAEAFQQALRLGPTTQAGKTARRNLAVTYNQMGVHAFVDLKDFNTAEDYFNKALDTDPTLRDAHDNLGSLYDRMGQKDRAMEEWRKSKDPNLAGSANPAAPGDTTVLQDRFEKAQQLYNQGIEAYNAGDVDKARDLWLQVISQAPGTPVAEQAKKNLDDTTSRPNF